MSTDRPVPNPLPDALIQPLLDEVDPLAVSAESLARVRQRLMRRVADEPLPAVATLSRSAARFEPYLAGVDRAVLGRTAEGEIWLLRMAPGAVIPAHDHLHGDEYSLVLEGACSVAGETLSAGDAQHAPRGSRHAAIESREGCLLWLRVPPPTQAAAGFSRAAGIAPGA